MDRGFEVALGRVDGLDIGSQRRAADNAQAALGDTGQRRFDELLEAGPLPA